METPIITGFFGPSKLLPFDGPRGLRREIIKHPVDALYLMGDALGNMLQERKGHILHGGGHGVHRIDRPNDDRPLVGPHAIPHAHGS